jgi:asparagine synthase (glutamine-hydrolysing)
LDNEFVRTVFQAPPAAVTNSDVSLRLISDGDARLAELRTDRGLSARQDGLSGKLLRQLLEFSVRAEYAFDYGMPQWVSKIDRVLSPLRFEKLFLGRHKFYHFRIWYKTALSRYVQEMLLDSRSLSRAYVQRKTVEDIVSNHVRGVENHTLAIHKLLTLELLHRLLLESPVARPSVDPAGAMFHNKSESIAVAG